VSVSKVQRNQALGEFLRSRRMRVGPDLAGVPTRVRRRVSGLRREEVAALAGISVDYYRRLEQGVHPGPSAGVLEAIATALHLPDAERSYLHQLVDDAPRPLALAQVRPQTLALMESLGAMPGVLLAPDMTVLASNIAARRLYADFEAMPPEERNAIHWMLTDPASKRLHGDDWEAITAEMIGMLRLRTKSSQGQLQTQRLVARLAATSDFFRQVWAEQVISAGTRLHKTFRHPQAGTLEMAVESLQVTHAGDQRLVVLMPAPGSVSQRTWREAMTRADTTG
jgi:transcriptional regulator with XRE-family HTH domain